MCHVDAMNVQKFRWTFGLPSRNQFTNANPSARRNNLSCPYRYYWPIANILRHERRKGNGVVVVGVPRWYTDGVPRQSSAKPFRWISDAV